MPESFSCTSKHSLLGVTFWTQKSTQSNDISGFNGSQWGISSSSKCEPSKK